MTWRTILTADEMRAAEAKVIAGGVNAETLMERAGTAAAEAIWRFAGPIPALVLCGPGNNGGDGYVIARSLRDRGMAVRVAAVAAPRSPAAQAAREAWGDGIEGIDDAKAAPLLIDALFGTGLARSLDEKIVRRLLNLAEGAGVRVAIDLPSGAATDDGRLLSLVPRFDLTISFGSLKPSHLLMPAAEHMGRLVVADIGLGAGSALREIGQPFLPAPSALDHKYVRGYAAILSGEMAGAGALAATAALRAGAGYVRLIGGGEAGLVPNAIIRGGDPDLMLADLRIDAIVVGPGLGRNEKARALLDKALAADRPLVMDGDALFLLAERGCDMLARMRHMPVLTPHAGEFERLFPDRQGSKVEQARHGARQMASVIVYKGADTVVAAPDGQAAVAAAPPAWLASAGTGDVLAGIVAAMRARGLAPFEAACAGVWLHGRAAELAGPALIADDLPGHLADAIAECL